MNQSRQPGTNCLSAIDLFCGCGGLTQGLKAAGFDVIAALDIDPLAIESYTQNHPEVFLLKKDIRRMPARTLRTQLALERGELDLLAGCPPCQGFSSMRTLNGSRIIRDAQNDLIIDFARYIREFQPKTIMLENVPGLAKDKRFRWFKEQVSKFGYRFTDAVLNAADYGVPQRRRRLIFLASKMIEPSFPAKLEKFCSVREAIGFLPPAGTSGDPLHDMPENRQSEIKDRIRHTPKDGGSRGDLAREYQLTCHQKTDGFKDVYGRMAWDKVAPTITTGCFNPSKGRFLHPEEDRAITPREAALLQTFPADYQFPYCRGKVAVSLLIGNALPPELIRKMAGPLKEILAHYNKKSASQSV